jgi:hypothetical protein
MKRITAMVIFSIVSSIVASTALAQQNGIQAKVPFSFSVSNETLPAGTYTITSPAKGLVLIQSSDRRISTGARSAHNGSESTNGCKLIFNKYGDQYFLGQVLTPNVSSLNVRIVPSKLEESVRSREASLKVNEQVQIAAR